MILRFLAFDFRVLLLQPRATLVIPALGLLQGLGAPTPTAAFFGLLGVLALTGGNGPADARWRMDRLLAILPIGRSRAVLGRYASVTLESVMFLAILALPMLARQGWRGEPRGDVVLALSWSLGAALLVSSWNAVLLFGLGPARGNATSLAISTVAMVLGLLAVTAPLLLPELAGRLAAIAPFGPAALAVGAGVWLLSLPLSIAVFRTRAL